MRMLALFLLFGLSSTYGYEYGNTVRAAKNNPYTLAYGLIAAGRPCIIADYEALTPSETVTKEDIQNALMICAFVSDRITKINTRAMSSKEALSFDIPDVERWHQEHKEKSKGYPITVIFR